ncbi:MAG TPA: hypothetical protein VMZ06_03720 [Candidatus Bathyarchaeia archaeon]|nr:hypothetical protein [Candidatus Bathyarchaeia archaeon]
MRYSAIRLLVLVVCICAIGVGASGQDAAGAPVLKAKRLAIVTGRQAGPPELRAGEIFRSRVIKRSAVAVDVVKEDAPDVGKMIAGADVVVVVGVPSRNELAATLIGDLEMALPTLPNSDTAHPEGFAVKGGKVGATHYVVVAGVDERGTLYGVGHLLRAMTFLPDAVVIPPIDAVQKPAFLLRGGRPTGPGSRARDLGNLRPQTTDEHHEVMEDLMLLGTNVYEGDPAEMAAYGMLTCFGRTANEMPAGFPAEWRADGGRSPKYVCPSVPEARKALLESFDEQFKNCPDYDFFTTNSGDEGGCRCEKCMPWGDKYIALVHDIADILHKYHPNTKVLATNQDLTNEGDQAIMDYLNSGDSSWLYAIRYGPGADEMQTYIRGPVNPRWFEYEGFGPLGNYLKFMHHELPRTTNIALYTDITHWMQAQFAVAKPDIALAAVYDRRSWNARPRNFHKVATEILHYSIGDMHYSEGMHDDFNKWFWYRMLWDPRQDAETLTKEYCRYWFGPEAQDEIAEAIFLMEETLEKPVMDNPGIARAVELLRSAGQKIPENLLKDDYRWRIIMEKALMDRYIQLDLERGRELERQAEAVLTSASADAELAAAVDKALEIFNQPFETPEMKAVMDEAMARGEESNTTIGYREPAPFIVATLDLSEVGWWKKVLEEAKAGGNRASIRNAINKLLKYEDPGAGGFYDDVGWPSESKHLTHGETLWAFMPFAGPAKHSHYNLTYTRGSPGVSFAYDGLDPGVQYVVRVSVGAHFELDQPALREMKLEEGLEADGETISDGFSVPMGETAFHEFDIPLPLTQDGKLNIALTSKPGFMPITGLYEIWLMQKDNMPWTARP